MDKIIKIKKNKRKGSLIISLMITIVVIGIFGSGLYIISSNMINLSNKEKQKLYVKNSLLQELNYYTSLKLEKIEEKTYIVKNNNTDILLDVKILDKSLNSIDLEITSTYNKISKSQKLKLIK